MRIKELLEGKVFNDMDFVTKTEGGRELNFDLVDDLVHYMNNDDTVYRKTLYPKVAVFIERFNNKKPVKSSIFEPAVKECYKSYIKKFPIRELPEDIENEVCKQVCEKLDEELRQHLEDEKYKD